jgi:hypothetical protein
MVSKDVLNELEILTKAVKSCNSVCPECYQKIQSMLPSKEVVYSNGICPVVRKLAGESLFNITDMTNYSLLAKTADEIENDPVMMGDFYDSQLNKEKLIELRKALTTDEVSNVIDQNNILTKEVTFINPVRISTKVDKDSLVY